MLFSLPADLRIIIWRKARYSRARDSLMSNIVLHDVCFSVVHTSHIGPYNTAHVCINIPHNKYMRITKNRSHHATCPLRFSDSYCVVNNTCGLKFSQKDVISHWYNPYQSGWVKLD